MRKVMEIKNNKPPLFVFSDTLWKGLTDKMYEFNGILVAGDEAFRLVAWSSAKRDNVTAQLDGKIMGTGKNLGEAVRLALAGMTL